MELKSSALNAWIRPLAALAPNTTQPAAGSSRGTGQVIRRERFDTAAEQDWYYLVRDIVALANSGGGRIVVPARLDENEIVHRLAQHIDSAFHDLHVQATNHPDEPAAMIRIGPALFPLGFSPAGGPPAAEQEFPPVSFYFRHGDRSEPGTTADMRAFFERLWRRVRRRWLRRIRRTLAEPIAAVGRARAERPAVDRIRLERAYLPPVRIVTDPNAPALQPQDVERLYPWRQKDLLGELNACLGRRALNSYDIQAVRRQHRLDERPDFVFNLPGAGRRYSPAVADWIMEQLARDPEFFHHARAADHELMRLRRKKPR